MERINAPTMVVNSAEFCRCSYLDKLTSLEFSIFRFYDFFNELIHWNGTILKM